MYISKLIASFLLLSSIAIGGEFGMAGCGPGSVIMGARTGQVFAATTNHSTSGQGFAMTSGTSNCDKESRQTARLEDFLKMNKRDLEKDVARGEGATLAAFDQLMRESQWTHEK